MTGEVLGFEAGCFGERPDLEEVDGFFGSVAFFGVGDAGSGGCHLEVASFEDFEVAHGVFTVDRCSLERGRRSKERGRRTYCSSSPVTM